MQNNWCDDELFEAYIEGRMEDELQEKFEQQLEKDEDLKAAFELHKNTIEELQYLGERTLLNNISAVQEKLTAEGFFISEDDIEDYIYGVSNAPTTRLIRERQKRDLEFAEQVANHNAIIKGLQKEGENRIEKEIQETDKVLAESQFFEEVHQQAMEQKKPTGFAILSQYRGWLGIAASFVLIILVYALFFTDTASQRLYADIHKPHPDLISEEVYLELSETGFADGEGAGLKALQAAMGNYNHQKYAAAIPSFETYLETATFDNNSYRYAKLYLAIAYNETGKSKKAKEILLPLSNNDKLSWQVEAKWYLALTHLQLNEEEEAKKLFEDLKLYDNYKEKATKALNSL